MEKTILIFFLTALAFILAWLIPGAITCGLYKRIFEKGNLGKIEGSDKSFIFLGLISFVIFLVYLLIVFFWSIIKWIAKGFTNFQWEKL